MSNQENAITGKWITTAEFAGLRPVNVFHRQMEPAPEPKSPIENRHILFRKKFSLSGLGDAPARLRVTADDYYKLYINGAFVTQGPCPGYHFHYYYNTIDAAPFLKPGENVLAVHTYYQGLINRVWVSGDDRHGLVLDLEVNGKQVLASDESFLCREHSGFAALGKAGYDTQFLEQYDSSSAEDGFERPEFDDRRWPAVVCRENPDWTLVPQPTLQLAFEPVKPVSLVKTAEGYIADFGKVYVGYFLLEAQGEKGGRVTLRFGQELNGDGSVRFELRANCRYEEAWVLSGGKDRLNQFDYKSFRYVELLLPPGGCKINEASFALLARHYPFRLQAACDTEDPKLRAVWDLCVNSLHYGVQEVIQDCMEREKGQYLGDGCYSAIAHGILTGNFAVFEKLILDTLRSSFINKGLMTCAPCSLMQEIADYPLFAPMFCVMYYQLTGNRDFLRQVFPGLSEMLLFYRKSYAAENGMLHNLDKWCVVEWPAPARDGYDADLTEGRVCKDMHIAINALYIGAGKFLNKMAGILGEPPVIDTAPLVRAFQEAFYDRKTGLFRDTPVSSHSSMAASAYPLLFNLCPSKEVERDITALIRKRRLSASMFYVTYPMLAGLVRTGERELCRELLADEGGWLRMLREGATTIWEGWGKESKWNTSLFHLTFTYPVHFLADWGMEKIFDGI
jgi:hypothetical protein